MSVLFGERYTMFTALFESIGSPGIVLLNVVMVKLYVAANMVIKASNIISVRISGEKAS